jgi:NADH:ubiquinone oxidoreductase subunit 3 (subunit A)
MCLPLWLGEAGSRANWHRNNQGYVDRMLILVIVLVVLWIILAIVGFAIKGLLWLGLIGIVLIIATLVIGFIRRSATTKAGRD